MMIRNTVIALSLSLVPFLSCADESVDIKAASVTGWNRLLDQPRYRWDFLAPPLDIAGANTVGAYNPDGNNPLPLGPGSPPETILATVADPFLEVVFPPFQVSSANPDFINLKLRDVPSMVRGDLVTRAALPFITNAAVISQSQAAPDQPDPITLGDWLKASGNMRVSCEEDGTAEIKIKVHDLIPHRAYTVWAMWHLSDGRIFPQPFGGVPNGYITDKEGEAEYERTLNFCPLEAARNGIDNNRLLSIITHLHSDHVLYGAVPTPSGAGLPPGTVGHMQLEWNFPGAGIPLLNNP